MNFAVCVIPVSPLRLEASHRSEMVSQQLFGEGCIIVERGEDHWIKVKSDYDGYEGWCQDVHVKEISSADDYISNMSFTGALINQVTLNGEPMQVPYGSNISSDKESIKSLGIDYQGSYWNPKNAIKDEATIRDISFRFLNTGYLWGGKSIFGIDCSGYTQTIYKFLGIPLYRDAYQQAGQGEIVGFLQEARCGDLAFFDNAEGKITHVGMLLNDHDIIHSSGKVRIDKIDAQGIINRETSERTHKLRIIKRYF